LNPCAYITFSPFYRWIDNHHESIILRDAVGEVVDRTPVVNNICGIQRVRLVGINAPEIGEEGYEEAKAFVNRTCIGEEFKLDVDDMRQYDTHYRILAVVYVNETNLNEKMVREGYAEVMYIPPSEFDSREWEE
jgi:endonuclease YncB( thermonuclease family)